MIQSTTDIDGRVDRVYGFYAAYGPGIPEKRDHMCSVVGTAPDRSSFNIYMFGGKNDSLSDLPGDIWALSLPRYTRTMKISNPPKSDTHYSALWIRMNTTDFTNNPKQSSTCQLVHDRYVFLYDGCWGGIGSCLSYGWNPLIYDVTLGDWNWNYDPAVKGYTVPETINNVIGGK